MKICGFSYFWIFHRATYWLGKKLHKSILSELHSAYNSRYFTTVLGMSQGSSQHYYIYFTNHLWNCLVQHWSVIFDYNNFLISVAGIVVESWGGWLWSSSNYWYSSQYWTKDHRKSHIMRLLLALSVVDIAMVMYLWVPVIFILPQNQRSHYL